MKLDELLKPENQSDQKPRITQDIADNGLKILTREDYLRNKPITKTVIYRLKNGIGNVYYYNSDGKIMAGGYPVGKSLDDIPIIGEFATEPLEL